jgi:hypothetical protein
MAYWPDVNTAAREYVATLNSPPDGWGQHKHPRLGQSHHVLLAILREFGEDAGNAAIDAALCSQAAE